MWKCQRLLPWASRRLCGSATHTYLNASFALRQRLIQFWTVEYRSREFGWNVNVRKWDRWWPFQAARSRSIHSRRLCSIHPRHFRQRRAPKMDLTGVMHCMVSLNALTYYKARPPRGGRTHFRCSADAAALGRAGNHRVRCMTRSVQMRGTVGRSPQARSSGSNR